MGAFAYSLRPIDIFMPAVDNGSVFVIGGDLPDTNSMTSAERVIASYDAETGRLRWKRFLSEQPDETLSETMVRGPVLIDQDTLICTGMRINQQKRVAGAYLFALSPDRGEVLWTRNIGSVGTERTYFARRAPSRRSPGASFTSSIPWASSALSKPPRGASAGSDASTKP